MIKLEGGKGDINISRSALATLVGIAVTSCYGVVGMTARVASDNLISLLKKENFERGIKVDLINEKLQIDLHIAILHGVNIKAISESIMHKVRYTMEDLSGFDVGEIYIHVDGMKV